MENLVLGPRLEGPEPWGRLIASPLVRALYDSLVLSPGPLGGMLGAALILALCMSFFAHELRRSPHRPASG